MRSWLDPRIEVRGSAIEGLGLFAREPIGLGEVVVRLAGRVIDDAEMRQIESRGEHYSALQVEANRHLLMDHEDAAARGNHSCDPNSWLSGALIPRRPPND